ncbi:DUF2243 domain-containing protein [Falsirhodobacter sp. 20TX0035]|uniref:DUF2243 domain-containing protein n=1 Tax=Falsirhodobacter sp. 20TX0035 TaxID=3022019 RepID=UPI00232F9A37|nr:DUF2243 domain-containing protein [Falsirhodobacter sp. 20TX0035]MDB6453706.1 DUF2243 domain-containing protein [Falsirhodobacter sp. 20TX0035]
MERTNSRRSLIATLPLGIGLMAAVDEVVFHQILRWHHFFDWSTPAFGIVSDGILHTMELMLFILGAFLVAEVRRVLVPRAAWAGLFLGMGGFQVFDGVIDHKVLRLHQIRQVENLWLYDTVWIAAGVALLLVGFGLARRA